MPALIDLPAIKKAIDEVAGEIAGMLREAPRTDKLLPRSQWTVGQTAAHLAVAQAGIPDIALGNNPNPYGSLEDFAPVNLQLLESFPERDGALLADLIVESTRDFLQRIGRLPDDQQVPTPLGNMEVGTLYAYDLAHLLMHGHPLAMALARPSPVNRDRALLTLPFLRAAPGLVFEKQAGPGIEACFEIRLRGGPRFFIVMASGRCTVEQSASRQVDCHIHAEPKAFFLVSTGVVGQWGPIASGKMLAWGRKPWLALRLKQLLPNP